MDAITGRVRAIAAAVTAAVVPAGSGPLTATPGRAFILVTGVGIRLRSGRDKTVARFVRVSTNRLGQGPRMRSLILAVSLGAIAVPAAAQTLQRGNADLQTYCAGDAITFCAGIDPNSPQMDACFKKNMSQMSPNCRSAIDAYKSGGGK